MAIIVFPQAYTRIKAAIDAGNLRSGTWGEGQVVCMMSGSIPGARSVEDCEKQGCPKWMTQCAVTLFDLGKYEKTREEFALAFAAAISVPFDSNFALRLFLMRRLERNTLAYLRSASGEWSDEIQAVERVVDLLRRQGEGEDTAEEMKSAGGRLMDLSSRAYDGAGDRSGTTRTDISMLLTDARSVTMDLEHGAGQISCGGDAYTARADLVSALRDASVLYSVQPVDLDDSPEEPATVLQVA